MEQNFENSNEDYREATGILLEIYEIYDEEEGILSADGFDDAIIGVDEYSMRIIYSVKKCIDILVKKNNVDITEATEYFEFNVQNAYIGEKKPIWCEDRFIGLM